jgi:urease accessory protein
MIAKLHIQAALRNGKTYLQSSFCTQPFKLADITEDKSDHGLHLMLMSSSPGILDKDDYKIKIELEDHCAVKLETQSYQRLFHMKTGARQEIELRMGKGSSFVFLPHPSVPHESSNFSSRNKFFLSEDCLMIWGEVLTCGRKLNGEVFRLSRYHSITEIFLSGKLIVKENLLIAPALTNVNVIGQLEGYTHEASITCMGRMIPRNSVIESIHELLLLERNISFGVSALPGDGFIVRILGYKAEQLYNCLTLIALHVMAFEKKKEILSTVHDDRPRSIE